MCKCEMKVGRELDELVAEKVMGLHVWEGCGILSGITVEDYDALTTEEHARDVLDNATASVVPYYSTDIAEAWKVVEEMRNRLFSSRKVFNETLRYFISCRMRPDADDGLLLDHSEVLLHVTPVEICEAALATVEIRRGANDVQV